MRVAHLESGRHLYGGAAQVLHLIDGLAAQGVDNVLICPRGSAISERCGSGTVIELPMGGDLDIALASRCRSLIRALSVDLLHVHSRRGADTFGGWAARSAGVPAVLSRRVDNIESRWVARWKYKPYGTIIAISRAIQAVLQTRMGVPPKKIVCVTDAVDTAVFRPRPGAPAKARLARELGFSPDRRLVGIVAQFIERKGHADLLAAMAELTGALADVDLVCFRQGPTEQVLRDQVAGLGLDKRVHFAGFRQNMHEWLPALTLLAHPARAEGLGVVLLEAQACGIPVVATTAGGIPEAIADGETGVLVPPQDVLALGNALTELFEGPSTLRGDGELSA